MTTNTISKYDDRISVEDIISRIEELQGEIAAADEERAAFNDASVDRMGEEREELALLVALLDDLKDSGGGDVQHDGAWYPAELIRDSYFKDYAMELADDIGAIPDNASWPCRCIDWDQASQELRMDYTSVEFDGVTYWVR